MSRSGRPRRLGAAMLLTGVLAALTAAGPLSPAPAYASYTIDPQQIRVQGSGAGAVIQRSPLRISYTDALGRVVLSEAEPGAPPLTLPEPMPGTAAAPSGPALHAPLSFLVGNARPSTILNGSPSGDLAAVEESGTEYSATEVIEASPEGEGVRLTLATDDPSGRRLVATIAPDGPGAIRLSALPVGGEGVAAMADSFTSPEGESFHGFGGRHNALDQHGQDFYNWVDQENIRSGSPGEEPGEENLVPNGPQAAYYPQASFLSSAGYGFLLASQQLSRWRMDSDRPDGWQTQVAAPGIEYVVAPGSYSQSIGTLTSINGRQRVPPAWAIGPLFDQGVELSDASFYEKQTERDIKHLIEHRIPVTAYRIEGWASIKKATLEHDIAQLKALGIRPLLYFRPFVGEESIGTEEQGAYATALAKGYVATDGEGDPFTWVDNFNSPGALIDFTKPAAVQWWKERILAGLELGAEGFMLDFGEQVQAGMLFSDGETGAEMHNRYPVLVQRVTREAVETFEAEHPGRTIVFFTRSGYSGNPGSAAYENFNFPGDETSDWSIASGLPSLTDDMLNRAVGGAYGYSTDIGGYWNIGTPTETSELFLRWAAWAALSPVFRLHGAVLGFEHTPWSFPEPARVTTEYKKLAQLHASAAPLITRLWEEAAATGIPITRPLWLEFPEDPQAVHQEQEWMLGPDVLVAPIVERATASRAIYFPAGCWHDPATGQQITGPASAPANAGVGALPFFFRCGTRPFTPPRAFAGHLTR